MTKERNGMSIRSIVAARARKAIGKDRYTRLRTGRDSEHFFLRHVQGVIHIGASEGQERELYRTFGLRVIWIEPIKEVFERLLKNISNLPSQRALNYLLSEEDGKEYPFHLANNAGESSSILAFGKVREIWPELHYTNTIRLTSVTLGTALEREGCNVSDYDALVLDTQGSEHKILSGASQLLFGFKYIKVEVADFEAYEGCCQIEEMTQFMASHGFREFRRIVQKHMDNVGTYYDVIYSR